MVTRIMRARSLVERGVNNEVAIIWKIFCTTSSHVYMGQRDVITNKSALVNIVYSNALREVFTNGALRLMNRQ